MKMKIYTCVKGADLTQPKLQPIKHARNIWAKSGRVWVVWTDYWSNCKHMLPTAKEKVKVGHRKWHQKTMGSSENIKTMMANSSRGRMARNQIWTIEVEEILFELWREHMYLDNVVCGEYHNWTGQNWCPCAILHASLMRSVVFCRFY